MEFFEKFNNENYLKLLADWKKKNEVEYLKNKPWLNLVKIRHEKNIGQVIKRHNKRIGYLFSLCIFLRAA